MTPEERELLCLIAEMQVTVYEHTMYKIVTSQDDIDRFIYPTQQKLKRLTRNVRKQKDDTKPKQKFWNWFW